MITQNKVIEIYSMADDFCKFFSAQIQSHTIEAPSKTRKYHRDNRMSDSEIITILILFRLGSMQNSGGYFALYSKNFLKNVRICRLQSWALHSQDDGDGSTHFP